MTVPLPSADSMVTSPSTSADALAHPDEPEAVGGALVLNPRPSSRTVTATASPSISSSTLDPGRGRVLGNVRERFLDHAVDRALDIGRQSF